MDLRTYLTQAPRGAGVAIAKALGVHPVMVSQYASGRKAVPEDRAPALEAATNFEVPCEESCPGSRWVRVPDDAWPIGRPLLDKAPTLTAANDDTAPAARVEG